MTHSATNRRPVEVYMELEVGDQALDDFLTFGQAGFIPILPRPRDYVTTASR